MVMFGTEPTTKDGDDIMLSFVPSLAIALRRVTHVACKHHESKRTTDARSKTPVWTAFAAQAVSRMYWAELEMTHYQRLCSSRVAGKLGTTTSPEV
jgi:hypothetical protein